VDEPPRTDAVKRELRRAATAARRAIGAAELAAARAAIRDHVLHRRAEQGWRTVAGYQPLGTEPGSVELLAALVAAGARVMVPRLLPDADLDWEWWTPGGARAALGVQALGVEGLGVEGLGVEGLGVEGLGVEGLGVEGLGVEAIVSVDAALVPALAVARDGVRLGRGGGSYDRALRRIPAGRTVGALLFEHELVAALPADEWDAPVNAVVTPAGWQDLPA
jgi:5-formyltetrahydrofolate cyclo-ligase